MTAALSLHPQLHIDVAPAYELLMELTVAARPELYEPHREEALWAAAVLPTIPPELLDAVQHFTAGCDKIFPHLVSLAYDAPPPRDGAALIDYLAAMDAMHLYLHLLGYHLRYFRRATGPEVMRAAAGGDAGARAELLRTSYPDDARWQAALRRLLALGPDEAQAETL